MLSASTMIASVMLASQQGPIARTSEPPDKNSQNEIIVSAPPTELERRRQLRKMAEQVIRTPRRGRPIASFFRPICPKVVGLPDRQARAIEERMRFNARKFGIGARSSTNCVHNISVVFMRPEAGDPGQWLHYDSPVLAHLLSYQRQWVINETGPVRSWNMTALRDVDGRAQRDRLGRDKADVDTANQVRHASRLTSPITHEIRGAVVLIELKSAEGKTARQLADYATLRSFVGTGAIAEDAALPANTLLTLFQDEKPATQLTVFDRSMIEKLYASSRNLYKNRQLHLIGGYAERIEREQSSTGGD